MNAALLNIKPVIAWTIFTSGKRSLGQSNVFTHVCQVSHSVHRGGGAAVLSRGVIHSSTPPHPRWQRTAPPSPGWHPHGQKTGGMHPTGMLPCGITRLLFRSTYALTIRLNTFQKYLQDTGGSCFACVLNNVHFWVVAALKVDLSRNCFPCP